MSGKSEKQGAGGGAGEVLREVTLQTRRIFEGKILNVRVDTVRTAKGGEATREVVEHRGAVAIVPLLEDGKVVLVRQFRQAVGEVLLEIPAGTLNRGENPEECARRELVEEIGYEPMRLEKMFSSYLAPGYSSELLHVFLATELRAAEGCTDEDETVVSEVMPLDEAVKMIRTGGIKDAKTICGLLLAADWGAR
jgi:ADP-ribose pyrophosphatase